MCQSNYTHTVTLLCTRKQYGNLSECIFFPFARLKSVNHTLASDFVFVYVCVCVYEFVCKRLKANLLVKWLLCFRLCLHVSYLTGVVAPEPPLDELFGAFPCIGDGSSLLPEFACDISHESTSCRVAFLHVREQKGNEQFCQSNNNGNWWLW